MMIRKGRCECKGLVSFPGPEKGMEWVGTRVSHGEQWLTLSFLPSEEQVPQFEAVQLKPWAFNSLSIPVLCSDTLSFFSIFLSGLSVTVPTLFKTHSDTLKIP